MTFEEIKTANAEEILKEIESINLDLFACRNGTQNGAAYMNLRLKEDAVAKRAKEILK